MFVFLRLFKKYRENVYFIFLLIIGVSMLHKSESYQGIVVNNNLLDLSAWCKSHTTTVSRFFNSQYEIKQLIEKNKSLQSQILNHHFSPTTDNFNLTSTKVVDMDIFSSNNYIVIDKGAQDEMKKGLVITDVSNNLVGFVVNVSQKYAIVQSILHSKTSIDCKLPDGTLGFVTWSDNNPDYVTMKNIPSLLNVKKGDEITTNGHSGFPANLMIGKVVDVMQNSSTGNLVLKIKLGVNFRKLSHLIVFENTNKPEIDSLKSTVQNPQEK